MDIINLLFFRSSWWMIVINKHSSISRLNHFPPVWLFSSIDMLNDLTENSYRTKEFPYFTENGYWGIYKQPVHTCCSNFSDGQDHWAPTSIQELTYISFKKLPKYSLPLLILSLLNNQQHKASWFSVAFLWFVFFFTVSGMLDVKTVSQTISLW